jgi:Rod binding domain-containing protein
VSSAAITVGHIGPTIPNSAANASVGDPPGLAKLKKAAGEFESILLDSLWKSMKETFADSEDPDADPTLKSFDEWGIQAMASAVGSAGGLGIKNMIIKSLAPQIEAGGVPPKTRT